MRPVALLALLAAGCSPTLQAVRGSTEADGVKVSFCGAERLTESAASSYSGVGPGGLSFGSGESSADLNRSDMCLTFVNGSDGTLIVDRRKIKLRASGYRGNMVEDGRPLQWKIRSGDDEDVQITFDTYDLDRGEDVIVTFKAGAVLLDGAPIKLKPLRLAYR